MNKLRTVLMYTIIIVLFVVAISTVNPVNVNAADGNEPYTLCIKEPIKK
ncbi:MAG: hypothetical protein WBL93_12920 [Lutisporaceae bacterium]